MQAEPRDVRVADRHRDPLRLPLDGDAPRAGGRRATSSSSRRATASTAPRSSSSRSASPSRAVPDTPGIELATHYAGTRAGRDVRRQARLHHRQAELRLRAGVGAAPVGPDDHARVALAGEALGQHEVARRRPGALRPAGRGPRPGRRGDDPRRGDRADRAARGRRLRSRRPTVGRRRRDALRGRRGDRRDRVPGAAPRPARAGRHDVRPEPAAGGDAVLGERVGARAVLRRDDRRRRPAG